MQARRADIDFESANPLWTPADPAFGHMLNGGSCQLPYLEPYLIKVMKMARERLGPEQRQLQADLHVFVQQEANHYTTHARYNAVLRRHYAGLEPFEAEIRDDFERFLAKRSLRWNLAYCEGFESLGLMQAESIFEQADALLRGSDPAVTALWRWHLAEEFEHRTVCHDVYHALYGGYLYRVGVLVYTMWHLFTHSRRVAKHLLAQDRAAGRLPQRAPRSWRESWRALRFSLPRFASLFSPWYTPRRRSSLPEAERFLEAFAAR